MKEVIKNSSLGEEYDNIRKIRNAVNYYGEKITTKEADEIVSKIRKLRTLVLNLFP